MKTGMKKNHLWWRFSVFFDKEVLLFYISSSFSLIYNKVYVDL